MSPTAAVVLCSGGLDSTTLLALARAEGRRVFALSFRYGQRHVVELEFATRQAALLGATAHETVDLSHLGRLLAPATALIAGATLEVPKDRDVDGADIPVTYVPARNAMFLTYGLAWAEVVGAGEIWIGVNAVDYSGYPDCRPEFIEAFQRMANLGTRAGVEGNDGPAIVVRTPLVELGKAEIIRCGFEHGVDYGQTLSCYDPDSSGAACGHCDSCLLRRRGFEAAGLPDPTRYKSP